MKYSFRQILDSLPVKKNSNSSWWVKLWVRRVSFFFTYFFINIGFTPNAVSVFSIFIVLGACICFAIPNTIYVAIAVILMNFWLVLDCVDGNIARCKNVKTIYGEFVDDIGGYFTVAFVYLAIGICAYNFGGVLVQNDNPWIIVAGGIACISDILARLIHKDYENFTSRAETEEERNAKAAIPSYELINKKSISYLRRRIGKELGISGAFMPLSIICAIFNTYDLMVAFYFLFNGFALLSTTVIYIYKADKYDKKHMVKQ